MSYRPLSGKEFHFNRYWPEAELEGERLAWSLLMIVEFEHILFTSYLHISKLVTAFTPLNFIAAISYASAASSCVPSLN